MAESDLLPPAKRRELSVFDAVEHMDDSLGQNTALEATTNIENEITRTSLPMSNNVPLPVSPEQPSLCRDRANPEEVSIASLFKDTIATMSATQNAFMTSQQMAQKEMYARFENQMTMLSKIVEHSCSKSSQSNEPNGTPGTTSNQSAPLRTELPDEVWKRIDAQSRHFEQDVLKYLRSKARHEKLVEYATCSKPSRRRHLSRNCLKESERIDQVLP